MRPPRGIYLPPVGGKRQCFRVKKSIYGLKQVHLQCNCGLLSYEQCESVVYAVGLTVHCDYRLEFVGTAK